MNGWKKTLSNQFCKVWLHSVHKKIKDDQNVTKETIYFTHLRSIYVCKKPAPQDEIQDIQKVIILFVCLC